MVDKVRNSCATNIFDDTNGNSQKRAKTNQLTDAQLCTLAAEIYREQLNPTTITQDILLQESKNKAYSPFSPALPLPYHND
jgi:hypothetical protein